jgi:hypothetical protein
MCSPFNLGWWMIKFFEVCSSLYVIQNFTFIQDCKHFLNCTVDSCFSIAIHKVLHFLKQSPRVLRLFHTKGYSPVVVNYTYSVDTKAKCRDKKWPIKGLCGRCFSQFYRLETYETLLSMKKVFCNLHHYVYFHLFDHLHNFPPIWKFVNRLCGVLFFIWDGGHKQLISNSEKLKPRLLPKEITSIQW